MRTASDLEKQYGVARFEKSADVGITAEATADGHGDYWELQRKYARMVQRTQDDPQNILPTSRGKIWCVPVTLKTGAIISGDTNDWTTTEYRINDTGQPVTRILVSPCQGVNILVNLDSRGTQLRIGTQWYPQAQYFIPSGTPPQEIRVPRAHYGLTLAAWNSANATASQSYPTCVTFIDDGPDYDDRR